MRHALWYGHGSFMGLQIHTLPVRIENTFPTITFYSPDYRVPFLGYIFAKKFRERHCDGSITFSRAFLFTTFMYMFASLFVAVVHYIYFRYIDGGFVFEAYRSILNQFKENCRSRTDNLTEPIRRSDRFTVGTYPAGNDISTDITKYVLRDANGYPYGIDRDA